MKYQLLSIFLTILLGINALGQQHVFDSLNAVLSRAEDEEKIPIHIALSVANRNYSFSDVMYHAREAERLCLEYNDTIHLLEAEHRIAIGYFKLGELDSSMMYFQNIIDILIAQEDSARLASTIMNCGLVYYYSGKQELAKKKYEEALALGKLIADTSQLISTYNHLGSYFLDAGNFLSATESYLEGLKLAEASDMVAHQSEILGNLGMAHGRMEDYTQAKVYTLASLELIDKESDRSGFARASNNLGIIYKHLGQLDSAIYFYEMSLETKQELNDKIGAMNTLMNLGNLNRDIGQLQESLQYYQDARDIIDELGDDKQLAELLYYQAITFSLLKDYDKAEKNLYGSLELSTEFDLAERTRDNYKALTDLYINTGNKQQAIKYFNKFLVMKDSLLNESNRKAILEMETKYETEKIEHENEALLQKGQIQDLEIKRQQSRFWALAAGIAIIALITLMAFILYRLRQRSVKTQLEMQNLENEQRMLRSQMNPHFIFNSMNSIQSYISGNDNFTAMTYLSKFAQLMRRILENSRNKMIPLEDEIATLRLYTELEGLRFKDKFKTRFDIDPGLELDATYVPPMLIQPFVENAIKHGFKTREKDGLLKVSIEESADHLLCIVEDNGAGRGNIEGDGKNDSEHRSLGLQVTRERMLALQRELGFHCDFRIMDLKDENWEASGTRVEIMIPFEKE